MDAVNDSTGRLKATTTCGRSSVPLWVQDENGLDGNSASSGGGSRGVPRTSSDGGPSPTSLVAMTRNAYSVPPVNPVTVKLVPVVVTRVLSSEVSVWLSWLSMWEREVRRVLFELESSGSYATV